MKKILFAALTIVLCSAITMAQECPTPATATATVTFKRHSTAPALDGVFTIDGSDHTVKFSRGNLQYKASTNTWQFAAHQYDFIGAANANIASDYSGWIDLFGWATNGDEAHQNGTHFQPWDSSTEDTYGNNVAGWADLNLSEAQDWGTNFGSGWRTLTFNEWIYLLDTRASGATVEGVANARCTHIAITIDAITITGLLLFPDGYNRGTPDGVSWNAGHINTHETGYAAPCTAAGWAALEDAGCVFLPYAGYRDGTTVDEVGTNGYYWTATSASGTTSRMIHIPNSSLWANSARHVGNSVRLVHQEP